MTTQQLTITSADGVAIHVVDHRSGAGADEPVVLVHGITESGQAWDPVAEVLVRAGHRAIVVDLRGHGSSGSSPTNTYDLATMAGDVGAVIAALGLDPGEVRLVGHSLGGTVVSALASALAVRSTVNVDQSLRLGEFQAQLQQLAPLLRDAATFPAAIDAVFAALTGDVLGGPARSRLAQLRRPDRDVVLAVWEPVLESSPAELDALVAAVAGAIRCPYLSLHGIDPGDGYAAWLEALIPTATVEVWDGFGHYPHLVDPERFVARLLAFWAIDR